MSLDVRAIQHVAKGNVKRIVGNPTVKIFIFGFSLFKKLSKL